MGSKGVIRRCHYKQNEAPQLSIVRAVYGNIDLQRLPKAIPLSGC